MTRRCFEHERKKRAERNGQRKSPEWRATSLSTRSRLTEWTARDVRAREQDGTRGEGKVEERKGAQGKGTSESYGWLGSVWSEPSHCPGTTLLALYAVVSAAILPPALDTQHGTVHSGPRYNPLVSSITDPTCYLRIDSRCAVSLSRGELPLSPSSPDRRKSPPDMSQCMHQHRVDWFTRVQWTTDGARFLGLAPLVARFLFGFSFSTYILINSTSAIRDSYARSSIRRRFMDPAVIRHTGSVMILLAGRAASINAATAHLRSGI